MSRRFCETLIFVQTPRPRFNGALKNRWVAIARQEFSPTAAARLTGTGFEVVGVQVETEVLMCGIESIPIVNRAFESNGQLGIVDIINFFWREI